MKKYKLLGGMSVAFLAVVALASCGGGSAKTYNVKFTNGNDVVSTKEYKQNEVIVAPEEIPEYKGEKKEHKTYTFDGWYENDFKFETGLKATKDYNFASKFNEEDEIYHVYFKESEDDTDPDVQKLKFGDPIVVKDLDDYKGEDHYWYNFTGWFDGETQLKDGDTCKGEQTFTAKFEKGELVEYTVSFYDHDDSEISTETGTYTEEVTIPSVLPYVDEEGYDWNFVAFEDTEGNVIEDGATFADTLDHEYTATYTKGDLHEYTVHVYEYGESQPTDFKYNLSIEGDESWITVRKKIMALLPSDTPTDHYTFGELIPVAAPREYDEITYSITKVGRYFEQQEALGIDSHFKFVDRNDTEGGWSQDVGKIEFTAKDGTAYLDTVVTDFALDFTTSSDKDNRLAVVLGANQDQLQNRSFVGGEGATAEAIDDGLVALSLMPESDVPFKLFYEGQIHEGLAFINKWTKGAMAKGVAVHISMTSGVLDITMNGIHLYQVDLSNYYKEGYIGFARGNTSITSPVIHKFTGTLTLADGSKDQYFSHNYTTEAGLSGLSHGIDLMNRSGGASVGRDENNKMVFNANAGNDYIQTVNAYDSDVHIKLRAQNIDEYAGSGSNDRFTVFFTDAAKADVGYFSDGGHGNLGENGDFSLTLVPGGNAIVRKWLKTGSREDITNVNTPAGNITDDLQYEFVIKEGKFAVYINGFLICEEDLPKAIDGTKKYIGICGTKKWDIKGLAITENSGDDAVMYDYTQLPDGYGPGIGLSYTNRGGTGSAAVSSGALTLTGHANGNLYTDNSYGNVAISFNYKSSEGRIMLALGSTDPTGKGYSTGSNMGDGLVGIMINCPAGGANGTIRVWDNSASQLTDQTMATCPDATTGYATVTIMLSGTSLSIMVGDDPASIAVRTETLSKAIPAGQICFTRGDNTSPSTISFQAIGVASYVSPVEK